MSNPYEENGMQENGMQENQAGHSQFMRPERGVQATAPNATVNTNPVERVVQSDAQPAEPTQSIANQSVDQARLQSVQQQIQQLEAAANERDAIKATQENAQQTGSNQVNMQAGTGCQQAPQMQQTASRQPQYATYSLNGSATNSAYNQQNYQGQNGNTPRPPKKKKEHKAMKFVGKAIAFGAIAGCVMFGVTFGFNKLAHKGDKAVTTTSSSTETVKTTTSTSGAAIEGSVSAIVDNCMPSIVSITSTFEATNNANDFSDFYYWFYGGNDSSSKEQTGSGSGVIVSETKDQLMVVTNNHVINDGKYGDAKKVQVTFANEKIVDAVVKGKDSDADLAVLTVNKSDLSDEDLKVISVAVLGDSTKMNVGDQVVAIGNALGYGQSVTSGIVSALNREVSLEDRTMTLLQTDAAINPGNSGGALLNIKGELIGINSVKYASDQVEGMGYAIPMEIAKPIMEELMNETAVAKGEEAFLGIYGSDVSNELASSYDMPLGVWVSNITDDSPAEKAGIQQRDIITKFNDHTITSMNSLQEQIAKKSAGTKVTLTIQRQNNNGKYEEMEIEVTLGKKSEASNSTENNPTDDKNQSDRKNNGNDSDDQDKNSAPNQDEQDKNESPNQDEQDNYGQYDDSDLWRYFFGY